MLSAVRTSLQPALLIDVLFFLMGLPQTFNESQVKLSCPLLQEFFAGLTSFYYYFLSIASMCYHFKNTHQLSACCVSDGFYRAVLVTLFTPIQNQYK